MPAHGGLKASTAEMTAKQRRRPSKDALDQLNAGIIRAVRYQLVFDHDAINALITGVAGGYFRVTDITFEFEGD